MWAQGELWLPARRCCGALSGRSSLLRHTAPASKLTCYSVAFKVLFFKTPIANYFVFPYKAIPACVFKDRLGDDVHSRPQSSQRSSERLPTSVQLPSPSSSLDSSSPLKSHMQLPFQASRLGLLLPEAELKEWHFHGPELRYFSPSTLLQFFFCLKEHGSHYPVNILNTI